MTMDTLYEVQRLLFKEARLIDNKQWEEWLELFEEDVEFWVPAWKSDCETTIDPGGELSLMYYNGRWGLEDRVYRVRTERSAASTPLPRTRHFVTNIFLGDTNPDACEVFANWVVHQFRVRNGESICFYGKYEYLLVKRGEQFTIKKKKITIDNDRIPSVLDFYAI